MPSGERQPVVRSLHAGIDLDWEMPAVTAWLFAAAGLALAALHAEQPRPGGRVVGRVVTGVACLSLALLPARVFSRNARYATVPAPSPPAAAT